MERRGVKNLGGLKGEILRCAQNDKNSLYKEARGGAGGNEFMP